MKPLATYAAMMSAVFVLVSQSGCIGEASARAHPQGASGLLESLKSAQPPMDYFIAKCVDLPDQASSSAIVAVSTAGQQRGYEMDITGIRAMAESHKLGNYASWDYWTVRGPTELRTAFLGKTCTIYEYADVPTIPAVPERNWIIDRCTCFGEATIKGETKTVWPCIWEDTMGLSVTTLSGVGPGVSNDGYGIE